MKSFLVIGAGSIGRRHIQCLEHMGIPNISIVDPSLANCELAEKQYHIMQSFSSLDEALESHFDGAVVAVPNHLHEDVACQVIEKGIDLILEKPIASDLESAKRIQEAVDRHQVICLVAYCFRFDPGMQHIADLIRSDALGTIYSVDISVGQYLPDWRGGVDYRTTYSAHKSEGGGVCVDLSHEFDYFRWLFGDARQVLSVSQKVSDLEIDVEDIAEAIIVTENGIIGRIHLDYLSRVARRRIYINGSKGLLEYNVITGEINVTSDNNESHKTQTFNTDRNILFANQLQHFIACVKTRQCPLIDVSDAIKTLELALRVRDGCDSVTTYRR